jgi:hypothetical protein
MDRSLKGYAAGSMLEEMQAGAMLFFHVFCRMNFAAKVRELHKLLDCL